MDIQADRQMDSQADKQTHRRMYRLMHTRIYSQMNRLKSYHNGRHLHLMYKIAFYYLPQLSFCIVSPLDYGDRLRYPLTMAGSEYIPEHI